jgi:hypothetical protein
MNALVSRTRPICRLARFSSVAALSMIALPISVTPGCALDGVEPQAGVEAAVRAEPLLRGFPANAPELNAIGAVYLEIDPGPSARLAFICTGTLINQDTVLTAKHCAAPEDTLYFGTGPDAQVPERTVKVTAIDRGPDGADGARGYDLAILHLAEPISDIRPMAIAQFSAMDVGKQFTAVGYGAEDNTRKSATRRMGDLTLLQRSGRYLEAAFGSFDGFVAWLVAKLDREGTTCRAYERSLFGQPPAPAGTLDDGTCTPEFMEALQLNYDRDLLETAGLVHAGEASEAQPCFGDSGGPLTHGTEDGSMQIYGVLSGGFESAESICDYGAFYTAFADPVSGFVDQALQWKEVCEGVSSDGVCQGAVATRCSRLGEGPRKLITVDCGALGMTCQIQPDSSAGCQ